MKTIEDLELRTRAIKFILEHGVSTRIDITSWHIIQRKMFECKVRPLVTIVPIIGNFKAEAWIVNESKRTDGNPAWERISHFGHYSNYEDALKTSIELILDYYDRLK